MRGQEVQFSVLFASTVLHILPETEDFLLFNFISPSYKEMEVEQGLKMQEEGIL